MPDRSYTSRGAERSRRLAAGALVLAVAWLVVLSGGRRRAPRGWDQNPVADDATHAAATFAAIEATVDARAAVVRPTITGERPPTPSLDPALAMTATIMAATFEATARDVPLLPVPSDPERAPPDPAARATATTDAAALARYIAALVGPVEEADAMADGEQGLFAAADLKQVCAGGRLVAPIEAHLGRLDGDDGLVAAVARVTPPAGAAAEVHGGLLGALRAWRTALSALDGLCRGRSKPPRPTDGTAAGGAAAVQRVRLAVHAFRRLAAQSEP